MNDAQRFWLILAGISLILAAGAGFSGAVVPASIGGALSGVFIIVCALN